MEKQWTNIIKRQEEILTRLETLERRVEKIEKLLRMEELKEEAQVEKPLDVAEMLKLPDNLRKTVLALGELGEATAKEVAAKTGRTRNIESFYLNQLARSNYITKIRRGKKVYFKAEMNEKLLVLLKEII